MTRNTTYGRYSACQPSRCWGHEPAPDGQAAANAIAGSQPSPVPLRQPSTPEPHRPACEGRTPQGHPPRPGRGDRGAAARGPGESGVSVIARRQPRGRCHRGKDHIRRPGAPGPVRSSRSSRSARRSAARHHSWCLAASRRRFPPAGPRLASFGRTSRSNARGGPADDGDSGRGQPGVPGVDIS